MKLYVISDTHGNYPLAMKSLYHAEPVDAVIHLGDGIGDAELMREVLDIPVISVAGNCDPGSDAPRELLCEYEGKRIFLTHGDAYGVKTGLERLKQRAIEIRADLVLFGHTHLATQEIHSGILFLNPGSLMNSAKYTSYASLIVSGEGISATLHPVN